MSGTTTGFSITEGRDGPLAILEQNVLSNTTDPVSFLANINQGLLERIVNQAKCQVSKKPNGLRYSDPVVERFAINAFILGGRRFYEILHANFRGAFPSIRSVASKLEKYDTNLKEGEIGATKLKNFLIRHHLPLMVSISEDATAVCGRREYYSKWNSVVGCSLPLLSNGLPNSKAAVAKNADDIIYVMEKLDRATTAIVVMAQPMADHATPLRLCSFGSNNKYSSEAVKNRLDTIVFELRKVVIQVLTYAADGDSRKMKVMRQLLSLGVRSTATNGTEF